MPSSRVFLVGLDAADKDLIDLWAGKGVLPNFSRLLDNALVGDVDVPRGLEAGCVWPTFYFGLRPGNMGQHDGARLFNPESYEHQSFQPQQDSTPPLWTVLSRAGKRCAVIDAPYHYPVDGINGMKVVDRAGHVPAGGGDFLHLRTHPPQLADEIVQRFGPDPAGGRSSDFFAMDTVEAVQEFVEIYSRRIESKTDMILHYWQQAPWDFFMSVFTEAHCAGHRCWHLHDPDYHLHDAELARQVGNPLREIYRALDRALGRLLDAVADDARVMVYLSHGMGPRHSATRMLDRVLAKLENQTVATRSGWLMDSARKVWRIMPEPVRKPFLGLRNSVTNDGFQPNRAGRRFFEVYANDRTAGVRINLQGRESRGVVTESEYAALCDRLIADLTALRNPESGEPVVREVLKTREHYSGPFLSRLPDLLVTWNRNHAINFIESDKVGRIDAQGLDMQTRTGDHRIKGRFFALAHEWQAQTMARTVNTEDLAPTLAALLGVEMGHGDGGPIPELLQPVPAPLKETLTDNGNLRARGVGHKVKATV